VLEWLRLDHSPAKVLTPYHELVTRLIAKGCTYCELLEHEPSNIVPFSKDQQHWLRQFSDLWQSALANFPGQVREHLLNSKFLQFVSLHTFVFPKIILSSPLLEAVTIFTDAFSPKIAMRLNILFASAQRAELYAVIMVLKDFPQQPTNLYGDSHYVVGVLRCIESVYIGHTGNKELFISSFSCIVWCKLTFIPVL
jgi:hypothetical protein